MTKSFAVTGVGMWLCVVVFYLYQYILRVSPSVMAEEMMMDMRLDASAFGLLSAVATYTYASLQIPAGILSDLYGTRRMVLLSIALCVTGVALFSMSEHIVWAYVGRLMIGAGSACAFLCVSKVASDWFPLDKKPLFFALTVTVGTLGALLGGKPLAHASVYAGWKDVLQSLVWVGLLIFIINLAFLKDKPRTHQSYGLDGRTLRTSIRSVFTSMSCWVYALIATGIYLCISVFADLWGVSFLKLKLGISKPEAAELVSLLYIGMCVGCLTMAFLIRYIDRRFVLLLGTIGVLTLMGAVIFIPNLTPGTTAILLLCAGLFSGVEVLCFSAACESVSADVAATVTGFVNFIVTMGAALLQMEVGMVLTYTHANSGAGDYTIADYQMALTSTLAGTFLSILLLIIYPNRGKKVKIPASKN